MTEKIDKILCSSCKLVKNAARDFYTSFSPFHKATGRLHVCKSCIAESVKENDIASFREMLRRLDKPFINRLYESAITRKAYIGEYFQLINAKDFKHMTWDDSDFEGHKNSKSIELNNKHNEEESHNYSSIAKKWGNGYSPEDLNYLENFFGEYENSYATDTPVQINLYKNIAKVHLQAEKELANGNIKAFKDLMELSSKLHNDGNIKPIQSTGANDDKGLSTYGLWIKTVEQEEPCEHFKSKPIYEDFDKLQKYIEKWFVRPFKNIFNISKDFDVEDDD